MKFRELVETVGELPVFRGSLLLAGDRDPVDVRRQLARWKAAGKVVQLRRNVYVLAAPWRRVEPHPFLIANELQQPSYVSLQSALAHHGLIPEAVPVTTSVTTGRPATIDTPLGRYIYQHVRPEAFFGYQRVPLARDQDALVADPAKALLDLVHLTPGGDAADHLHSLRLEGLEEVRPEDLRDHARRWNRPKIDRAVEGLLAMKRAEETEASLLRRGSVPAVPSV
jgi:predicted transcriptional regulator of viral defense system